ncbi:helix-turn-helix domain-containing protein [Dickeya dadantii]|uniref:DNA-3-methyladenine glycosylase 2 family protein n=1 Tax=Dickeya dadantii TaxID=204038 RepID=UPI001CF4F1CE|nr:Ada metal-binding domain-containing protein [Dickeya dadantii]MCA7013619.1 helix-turn-helix domain-containing protein [Dickeya dadantii]
MNDTVLTIWQQARISRDPRFDGTFFVAVKSTGIFCRPICPASLPLEKNVVYYRTRTEAIQAGFRPCLRCKPEYAPRFAELDRKQLLPVRIAAAIDSGEHLLSKVEQIADVHTLSSRYLNRLFREHYGCSVKEYQNIAKIFFAKKLFQSSSLSITDIAASCGFSGLSGFYQLIDKYLKTTPKRMMLAPSDSRNKTEHIRLRLPVGGRYHWDYFLAFQSRRLIDGVEWIEGATYGRRFILNGEKGSFQIRPATGGFDVTIALSRLTLLSQVLERIRNLFDLNVNIEAVEDQLRRAYPTLPIVPGIRIPGVFSPFEAALRAVCGQQVSVSAATTLLNQLVSLCAIEEDGQRYFPTPDRITPEVVGQLRTMQSKKATLVNIADWFCRHDLSEIDRLTEVKGVGRWTLDYLKLRSLNDPDIWLGGDLGIRNALRQLGEIDPQRAAPWKSYLTLHLWNTL